MFGNLILWRVTKTTYAVALIMALILLMVQIFRFGFILFGLPFSSSFMFFVVWFFHYTFFFLTDGLIASVALTAYDLKERKHLHILYSFGKSPYFLFRRFLVPMVLFFLLSLLLSFFSFEEHVSFVRRGLLLEYKDRLFQNVPLKTFLSAGDLVLYAGDRKDGELKNVFLKYKNTNIVAQKAKYEGMGRFSFTEGSLLTKERGKYLLIEFENYWLDTEEKVSEEIRKKRIRRDRILNLVNTFTMIPMASVAFWAALLWVRTHTQVYYLIVLLVIIHQLLLFGVKVSLKG